MKVSDGCRLLGFAVLAAAISEPGLAAKFTDQEHTRIEEPRPADLPSDSELEAAGAIIGKVDIDIRNIFDPTDPRETNGLFLLANRLHLRTKHSSIQAQLLFASGDKYRARKLAETERALRLLTYVYDARVVPVRYADGKVDVRVITKDVWTLSPGISFGRAGGTNSTNFNLQDTNFLGWGKTLQVSRGSTVDRTSDTVAWTDPNVFGSRWTSALTYSDSSDGSQRSLQVTHPFYSLDAPWSTKITVLNFNRTISRYNLGDIVDQFNDKQSSYELSGGVSNGLIDGWTKRLTFGMRYDRNLFLPAPGTSVPAQQLPPDRTLSYPFVGFDILQDKYKKIGDENQIGRAEDLYFGTEVTGEAGLSKGAFGADRNAVMLAAKALRGIELTDLQQLFLTSDFASRIENGRARNLIADAGATPAEVDYVNAHGTSTQLNDAAETVALKRALGEDARRVPISSTKSAIGHLLGAAGAVEAVATLRTLITGLIAPTLGYEVPDPELDLDYVPGEARPLVTGNGHPPLAISNSFAFGGHNVALAFRGAPK